MTNISFPESMTQLPSVSVIDAPPCEKQRQDVYVFNNIWWLIVFPL